jgi:hypothetical protein
MYGVLGEDRSDADMLKELIFSLAGDRSLTIKTKGYSSCGELLTKGARQVAMFRELGCNKFVICYDSDRDNPDNRKASIINRIIRPSMTNGVFCALVPIQEIEAWILADLPAVSNIITGWIPTRNILHPEEENDPKEFLEKLSRKNQRPRYSHATHNPRIAKYLNLAIVEAKCPSFRPLVDIVRSGLGNVALKHA